MTDAETSGMAIPSTGLDRHTIVTKPLTCCPVDT